MKYLFIILITLGVANAEAADSTNYEIILSNGLPALENISNYTHYAAIYTNGLSEAQREEIRKMMEMERKEEVKSLTRFAWACVAVIVAYLIAKYLYRRCDDERP